MKSGLITSEKGVYVLIIRVPKQSRIKIGFLGKIIFRRGFYAYVGSALNGLRPRIERHLNNRKRIRWHIDYLLGSSGIIELIYGISLKREECKISSYLTEELDYIKRFGSSDCKCGSHLFYSDSLPELRKSVLKAFKESDLKPADIKINNRNGPRSIDREGMRERV